MGEAQVGVEGDVDIARVAALIGDRARGRILTALGGGRSLPASRLASEAGVSRSTASGHLARLVDGGLLVVQSQGRHRCFRIADPAVAAALEALAQIAPPAPVRSLREGTRAHALRAARTCYDHLAGRLGVALMAAMLERGDLEACEGTLHLSDGSVGPWARSLDYRLTGDGRERLLELGVHLTGGGRRPFIRYCVDWSEQRPHLAGALGAALLEQMLVLGWIQRSATTRAVRVTTEGSDGFGGMGLLLDVPGSTPS